MSWKALNPLAREERGSKKTPRWEREEGKGGGTKEGGRGGGEQPGEANHSHGGLANSSWEVKKY